MSLSGVVSFIVAAVIVCGLGYGLASIGDRAKAQMKADLSRVVLVPAQITYSEPVRLRSSTSTDLHVWAVSVDGQRFVVVANHEGVAMHALAPATPLPRELP